MRRLESQMSFWIDEDEDEDFLNLNRTLLSKSPDQTQFFFRHSASILFSVLENRALYGHHLLALNVLARLFVFNGNDSHSYVPQFFNRFMTLFNRITEHVAVGDHVYHTTLELICDLPVSLLRPNIEHILSVIMRLSSLQCIRRLARSQKKNLTEFLSTILPFRMGSNPLDSAIPVIAEVIVLCDRHERHSSEMIAFLLPLAETSEVACKAIYTIIANDRVDSQIYPMLRFFLAHHTAPFVKEALCWLLYRSDLGFLPDDIFSLWPDRKILAIKHRELRCEEHLKVSKIEQLRPVYTPVSEQPNLQELLNCSGLNILAISRWFSQFEQLCISKSPHSLIAAFKDLAQLVPFVARGLLPVAFYSVFVFFEEKNDSAPFTELFQKILRYPETPADVLVALTTVVEFMDRALRPVLPLEAWPSCFSGLPAGLRGALVGPSTPEDLALAYTNVGLLNEARHFATTCWFVEPVGAILHSARLDTSKSLVGSFETIADFGGARFAQGFSAVMPSIAEAQFLIEKDSLKSDDFIVRLRGARDFIIPAGKILLFRINHRDESACERELLIRLTRKAGDQGAFERFQNEFFPDIRTAPPRVRFDLAKWFWEHDKQTEALDLFATLPRDNPKFMYHRLIADLRVTHELTSTLVAAVEKVAGQLQHRRARYLAAWANFWLVKHDLGEHGHLSRIDEQLHRKEKALEGFLQCALDDSQHKNAFMLQFVSAIFCEPYVNIRKVGELLENIDSEYFLGVIEHLIAECWSPSTSDDPSSSLQRSDSSPSPLVNPSRAPSETSAPLLGIDSSPVPSRNLVRTQISDLQGAAYRNVATETLGRLLREHPYEVICPCLLSITCDLTGYKLLQDALQKAEHDYRETRRAVAQTQLIINGCTTVALSLSDLC
jgi:hypothetical protein